MVHVKKSIRDDFKKDKGLSVKNQVAFFYEMGNMELSGLKQCFSVTSWCHSCIRHLPEGMEFCECGVCLRPHEETMNRVRCQISSFESTVFSCTSESFKRKQTQRSTMARRPLESSRRQKRSTETLAFLDIEQVGE